MSSHLSPSLFAGCVHLGGLVAGEVCPHSDHGNKAKWTTGTVTESLYSCENPLQCITVMPPFSGRTSVLVSLESTAIPEFAVQFIFHYDPYSKRFLLEQSVVGNMCKGGSNIRWDNWGTLVDLNSGASVVVNMAELVRRVKKVLPS